MESVSVVRSGAISRKSSNVVVIAHNDIAEIKVRKQSSNLLAQQLQQQLILQQQQQLSIRRDQVFCLISFNVVAIQSNQTKSNLRNLL